MQVFLACVLIWIWIYVPPCLQLRLGKAVLATERRERGGGWSGHQLLVLGDGWAKLLCDYLLYLTELHSCVGK